MLEPSNAVMNFPRRDARDKLRGYTRYTVDLVQQLQARRLPIIAITDSELSPLAELATVVFTVAVTLPSILESQTAAMSVCNAAGERPVARACSPAASSTSASGWAPSMGMRARRRPGSATRRIT